MSVGIIDIGIGNLGSLRSALYSQGWDCVFVSNPSGLDSVTHLLLPGVGAFAAAVKRLHECELFEPIRRFAADRRPVMGICLGMQLLAERGTEGGDIEGLGLVAGTVNPINAPGLRLPHMGWNNVHQAQPHPLIEGIRDEVDFYFVHSYQFAATHSKNVLAHTEYGERFVSIVCEGNVVGVQFHPEKSQSNGLRLLDNFCLWDGAC